MADQIHVDHAELRSHADKLDEVGSNLSTTAGTARGINLHDGAFGVMMAWLPGVVEHFNPVGADTISSAAGVVQRTGTAIRALADDFHDTDSQIADAMNHIKG
ncbi:MAG: type VII secretion target [Nocardioides sp.]